MRDITRWDPWHDMQSLRNEIEGLIDRAASGTRLSVGAPWRPVADVVETDHTMIITAELPGCKDDDVKVSLHGGVLTIRGHRTLEQESGDAQYHRRERSYGDFQRSFRLPDGVEQSDVHAHVAYGVLKVTIDCRNAREASHEIPVTGGD
jgi:HSP20 family protein